MGSFPAHVKGPYEFLQPNEQTLGARCEGAHPAYWCAAWQLSVSRSRHHRFHAPPLEQERVVGGPDAAPAPGLFHPCAANSRPGTPPQARVCTAHRRVCSQGTPPCQRAYSEIATKQDSRRSTDYACTYHACHPQQPGQPTAGVGRQAAAAANERALVTWVTC